MDKAPTFKTGPDREAVFKPVRKRPPTPEEDREHHRFLCRAAWKRCRLQKLKRSPMCERCRKAGDPRVPAVDVHHVIEVRDAPGLAYDLANLESLCKRCHGRETRTRQRMESRRG
ncbi:HNH endonuclease signature motif containing protein [Paludisphaera soli]|uniref:HNH endonuclease signature motif containing protein n=1 Tax=Paludisphaera soli TaxID=2712865 RepID=UPI0013EA99FC|nr:HNH endonuclease signature motif containing protein [Paludisphaera soli]